ncbi:MAG: ATP phosphoribosyltransferase regulatory subunit [Clostridia bacterium]|nr:ATP phosphoribosyltransferase regulatory subunit [Clostridia bacterium]
MDGFMSLLTREERVSFALRARYLSRGFSPYRMGKFEEYDLYAKNKDFLLSPQVITFTDTDGKLLALKPDVTLSIAKNFDAGVEKQKLFYSENVYRPTQAGGFREILQSGIECMGNVGQRECEEVLLLACECLSDVSPDFVLSVSDLDLLESLFSKMGINEEASEELSVLVRAKNAAEAARFCRALGVEERLVTALCTLITKSAPLSEVLIDLPEGVEASEALLGLAEAVRGTEYAARVRFDLSVLPNRRFYNGVVFAGYLAGAANAVLAGGRYDKLMRRLKKTGGAIGFAVYLNHLPKEKVNE